MPEMRTIEPSSFSLSPTKSTLVIHSGQVSWPVPSMLDDEFS